MDARTIFSSLPDVSHYLGQGVVVHSPVDGSLIGNLKGDTNHSVQDKVAAATTAFQSWSQVPAPKRGELVRIFGIALRQHQESLARLITLECGKILAEARAEVQEMIDMADFTVGLSRQLYGLTMASERPLHTMQENWLPLGPVGIISAFNFPVAVWAWNAMLSLVCGNSILWKPSEKTPFSALVCHRILKGCYADFTAATGIAVPEGLGDVLIGDASIGESLVLNRRIALISATGSTRMGQEVGPLIAGRFGRSLLELGGNNAVIVSNNADLKLALHAIIFGAVGTAGQRCTSTRRVLVQRDIYDSFCTELKTVWQKMSVQIGSPFEPTTLVGPLINKAACEQMQQVLRQLSPLAKTISGGQRVQEARYPQAYYVTPALVCLEQQVSLVMQETFAPITYVLPYNTLEEALVMNNAVSHGLSSAIFTTDIREAEYFKRTSDCGIANVNVGTSGAEIGGAFGGEKETGGGREAGSDAWKHYMRRQTSTTYAGTDIPKMAQGIKITISP